MIMFLLWLSLLSWLLFLRGFRRLKILVLVGRVVVDLAIKLLSSRNDVLPRVAIDHLQKLLLLQLAKKVGIIRQAINVCDGLAIVVQRETFLANNVVFFHREATVTR